MALLWATRGIGAPRGGRARPRRFLAATAVIAATAGAGSGIAAVLPAAASRTVIRDAVTPPFDPRAELSPLVAYRNSVLPPGAETVLLRVGGLPEGSRLRLAVLDDYDGRVFAVGTHPASGAYERIPLRVVRLVASKGRQARVAVTVEDYRGPWLPTAGAVESITLDGFLYNSAAGAGAVAGEVGKGTRYTMRTVIEGMSEDASIAAAVPPGAGPGVSSVPPFLADAVSRHAGDGSPGARLLALTTWLRAGYTSHGGEVEPPSRSGHSLARLSELVGTEPMVGDAEQYAPALALMARQLGFPSRVVVGYEPASDRVTGAYLTAWVEVRTADGRWLAIDPNPPEREAPDEDRESTEVIALPETVLPPPPPPRPDAVSSTGSAGDDKKPEPELPEWRRALNAVLGVAAVAGPALAALLAPLWLPALLRGVLRGRRWRKDRRERVLTGGWSQVRDRIAELGESVPRAATRQELAAIARSAEVMALAAQADRVAFDAYEPTQAEVDAYWAGVYRARSGLLRAHGVRTRVRVMVSWRGILSGVKGRRRCQ
ncbi:hypothetical protein ATY41_06150 [Leifsonia xyli subsp. xyli]|uniref:Transglutaminase-like domain-containing protein n=2 Tax=Leifsonia xyli TaxID=1575 RepID=A0A1E2SHX7_LEIXY|nr:transglutaminase domain-containing protein [Leifsonia xyli]ODA89300.1 hypothetical protein ATY41_06150 [Leifsonia xyli subsp. xyli]